MLWIVFGLMVLIAVSILGWCLYADAVEAADAKRRRKVLDAQWQRFFEYAEALEGPEKALEYKLKAMRAGAKAWPR